MEQQKATAVDTSGKTISATAVSYDSRLSAEVLHGKAVSAAVAIFSVGQAVGKLREESGAANGGRTIQQYLLALAQDRAGFPVLDRAIDVYSDAVESACLAAGVMLKGPNNAGKGGWRRSSTLASSFSHARKVREQLDAGCEALLQSQGLRGAYRAALDYEALQAAKANKAAAEERRIADEAIKSAKQQEELEAAAERDRQRDAKRVEHIRTNPVDVVGTLWQQFMAQVQEAAQHNPEVYAAAKDAALGEFGNVKLVEERKKAA